jgi:hypothetical protein
VLLAPGDDSNDETEAVDEDEEEEEEEDATMDEEAGAEEEDGKSEVDDTEMDMLRAKRPKLKEIGECYERVQFVNEAQRYSIKCKTVFHYY